MSLHTKQIEAISKGCGKEMTPEAVLTDVCGKTITNRKIFLCPVCQKELTTLKQCNKDFNEFVEKLKAKIKINGNLSNRITGSEEDGFEIRHDSLLNNIVLEIIDDVIDKLINNHEFTKCPLSDSQHKAHEGNGDANAGDLNSNTAPDESNGHCDGSEQTSNKIIDKLIKGDNE